MFHSLCFFQVYLPLLLIPNNFFPEKDQWFTLSILFATLLSLSISNIFLQVSMDSNIHLIYLSPLIDSIVIVECAFEHSLFIYARLFSSAPKVPLKFSYTEYSS